MPPSTPSIVPLLTIRVSSVVNSVTIPSLSPISKPLLMIEIGPVQSISRASKLDTMRPRFVTKAEVASSVKIASPSPASIRPLPPTVSTNAPLSWSTAFEVAERRP